MLTMLSLLAVLVATMGCLSMPPIAFTWALRRIIAFGARSVPND